MSIITKNALKQEIINKSEEIKHKKYIAVPVLCLLFFLMVNALAAGTGLVWMHAYSFLFFVVAVTNWFVYSGYNINKLHYQADRFKHEMTSSISPKEALQAELDKEYPYPAWK